MNDHRGVWLCEWVCVLIGCVVPQMQGLRLALPCDSEVNAGDAGVAAGLEVFHRFVLHL